MSRSAAPAARVGRTSGPPALGPTLARALGLILGLALVLTLAVGAGSASAHGLGHVASQRLAWTVEFRYSDGEPMAYAEAKAFAPSDAVEFQNGRTDRLGRFAFLPDAPGDWIVVAKDGMGHGARVVVTATEAGDQAAAGSPAESGGTPSSLALRALLGVSLLLNFAAVGALRRRGIRKE